MTVPPNYDVEQALMLLRGDPVFQRVVEAVGPFRLRIRSNEDVFNALLRSIVYQQISGKAAAAIYGRLVELLDGRPSPESVLATPVSLIRGAGLSRFKTSAAIDLASKVARGEVPAMSELENMSDAAVIEGITRVRGVGEWTAQMLLIFYLGRPDVFPTSDAGIVRGFQHAYGLVDKPSVSQLRETSERWQPYRSVAAWYLWRAVDVAF